MGAHAGGKGVDEAHRRGQEEARAPSVGETEGGVDPYFTVKHGLRPCALGRRVLNLLTAKERVLFPGGLL